jgi:DNA-binding response OmpR family regulator
MKKILLCFAGGTALDVLIVDDDLYNLKLTSFLLEDSGYNVIKASNGSDALRAIQDQELDIILLDVEMPQINGFDLCREIRCVSSVPIIFVSGRDQLQDRVMGLQMGADDYLTKPFEPLELLARMGAVLRRWKMSLEAQSAKISQNGITLDPLTHIVTFGDNQTRDLTPIEFRLLYYLMQNAGRILSTDQILDNVWGYTDQSGRNLVAVYIRRLRSKFEAASEARERIRTVTKIGYCFDA